MRNTHPIASGIATTPMNRKHHCQLISNSTPARIKPRTDPRAPDDEKLRVAKGNQAL
jgi:hypothetical protein